MTRKDFELIAGALAKNAQFLPTNNRGEPIPSGEWRQHQEIAEALADALATTNPRFDRDRFVAACFGQ